MCVGNGCTGPAGALTGRVTRLRRPDSTGRQPPDDRVGCGRTVGLNDRSTRPICRSANRPGGRMGGRAGGRAETTTGQYRWIFIVIVSTGPGYRHRRSRPLTYRTRRSPAVRQRYNASPACVNAGTSSVIGFRDGTQQRWCGVRDSTSSVVAHRV